MPEKVRIAVIGLGRIGLVHAQHAQEVAAETGACALTAVVDSDVERARETAPRMGPDVAAFGSVEELAEAEAADAAVISTPTDLHREHAEALIAAGLRVLLEKPMTDSVAADRAFVDKLNREAPQALMLAFQRRFDEPLRHARKLLHNGAAGRPFKLVSILEDSRPLPDGYASPGLLYDMSVHNVDETLWILGRAPETALAICDALYSHRLTTSDETYDDGLLQLWFEGDLAAQIGVSRNHVPGYRVETWIFGEEGVIHVGRFEQKEREVVVEAYGREKAIEQRTFTQRDYGRPMPEFVGRFGAAYKAELAEFVERCRTGEPFDVTHEDGLRAMAVIDAGVQGVIGREKGVAIEF